MSNQDFVRRFVFDKLDARGCIVSLDKTCVDIQQTHYYPPNLAKVLNEFALAAVLLHDSIKIKGSITIQLRCNLNTGGNPISLMMADCMFDRKVRAIAEFDSELLPASVPISLIDFATNSVLTITITPAEGERYQSIVPMEHVTLSDCLEDYFARSEQLPTWFKLLADEQRAVGIALHALPIDLSKPNINDTDSSVLEFSRLKALLNTLTLQEALDLDTQEILTRLFHQEFCRLFEPQSVEFGCVCSKQKSLDAIKSLGQQEVIELIAEQSAEGRDKLFVDCHFCFQRYEFSFSEVKSLFS